MKKVEEELKNFKECALFYMKNSVHYGRSVSAKPPLKNVDGRKFKRFWAIEEDKVLRENFKKLSYA